MREIIGELYQTALLLKVMHQLTQLLSHRLIEALK